MRLRQHLAGSVLVALVLAVVGGCQLPWSPFESGAALTESPSTATASAQAGDSTQTATEKIHAVPQTEEEALAGVLDQLQQIGAVDPQAKQQLMADLHNAKPEHWRLIVQQFQAALAYRQQLAAKQSQDPSESRVALNDSPFSRKTQKISPPASRGAATPVSFDANERRAPTSSPGETLPPTSVPAVRSAVVTDAEPSPDPLPENIPDNSVQPLPPPPERSDSRPPNQASAGAAASRGPVVQQVVYASPATGASPWQDHLHSTIAELEQSTSQTPSSTDEVHEHMRLRMLYLLANQEEEALQPIPGATPSQQDYWAKQMFAVSTFLDNARQPDSKQRAAGTLVHLDQARSKLAELATLQVRNLLFVNGVEGFGVYERRQETKFRPGDQVTLYAEVENFRSDSTEKGYRTSLATSYQVVDQKGQRVDSGQFPEVEDLCHNLRRDFHMQYGVALPTRIYPGQYELRLIITDQLSHKIGQASVPFEIVE